MVFYREVKIMWFYGFLNLPWWGPIVYALVCTHITIIGVTVFLHRHQAHRALDMHPIISHFFRGWLWLTTGMETRAWAAIHRKHHAKCETPDDPHSPIMLGLKKVLFEGAELYRVESKNEETIERYGKGTPDDWLERNLYRKYSARGIFLNLFLVVFLMGVPGFIVWAVQMAWIPFFAAGVINGVGHYVGYRNFECPDAATNISPWGILIGGEELHNNHHTFPTSAKLSYKWYEFDIGWMYIQLFSLLGLAKVKRVSPREKLNLEKTMIDLDTVRSVISARFQVMAKYTHSVILPLFDSEVKALNDNPHNIREALIRETILLDESSKEKLNTFLSKSAQVNFVYQLRNSLQSIWNKTTASQKELLDSLREWCKQAEEANVGNLRDFVAYIRRLDVAIVA
jgi:stearoyl-CoA desaturase (delta-9 desaturase)